MNRSFAAVMAAITVAASAPALAEGWYAGLSLGRTDVDVRAEDLGLTRAGVDKRDWSYGARVGYDFTKFLGAEVAYYDLGRYGFGGDLLGIPVNGEAKLRAWNVSLVGNLPISDALSGYGKIGYARTKIRGGDDNTEAVYGLGGKWMVDRSWGLFGEWNRYQDTKLDNYMAGALIRF
jgi:hypothetical protein